MCHLSTSQRAAAMFWSGRRHSPVEEPLWLLLFLFYFIITIIVIIMHLSNDQPSII